MKEEIIKELKDVENKEAVENFAAYCTRLSLEKKQDGTLKNPWMKHKTAEQLAKLFKRVEREGLVFDGKHITLQSTGISYDYIAYKNKMYLAYPDSQVDVSVVNEGDVFSFEKENGKVVYTHKIADPFKSTTTESLVGAYCVVKNSRGEFLTLLSKEEIEKHRKVAKTDYIWKQWFKEMVLKTVVKKACKLHFDDVYRGIEETDNDNYSVDNPVELALEHKSAIDEIDTLEELQAYYEAHKGAGKELDKYIIIRKQQINENS